MDIVRECAEAWDRLITGKTDPGEVSMYVDILYVFLYFADLISFFFLAKTQLFNTHQPPQIPRSQDLAAQPIDPSIDKWFFISGAPSA